MQPFPPSKFLGNKKAAHQLSKLISSPPQALIFSGPEGIGKFTLASHFAQHLLQTTKQTDLSILKPEGKVNLHPIDSIRALITSMGKAPFESKRKIFIIDDADRMYTYAANALLKILEEPPAYGHLILITSHVDKLLPTIRSRCTEIPFQPLSKTDILTYLKTQSTTTDLEKIATLSQGSLSKAQKLLTGDLDLTPIIDHITANKPLDGDAEELLPLLHYWYRDLHLLKAGADPCHLFYKDHFELLQKEAQKPLPPLETIQKRLSDALEATHRGIKLKSIPSI